MPPVTSLEVSKRMKELGFEQKSYFWWVMRTYEPGLVGNNPSLCLISCHDFNKSEHHRVTDELLCSAYLSDEIAEILPMKDIQIQGVGHGLLAEYKPVSSTFVSFGKTLVEALAGVAIYLKEQGII